MNRLPKGSVEPTLAGSISHGTLRPQDLIPRFFDVLESYGAEEDFETLRADWLAEVAALAKENEETEALLGVKNAIRESILYFPRDESDIWDSEFVSMFLNEDLFETLQSVSPVGYYFGSHPGDGADFGFWIEEFSDDTDFSGEEDFDIEGGKEEDDEL